MYSNNDIHHNQHHYCPVCGQPTHGHFNSSVEHERFDRVGLSTSVLLFIGLILLGLLVFRTNVFNPSPYNSTSAATIDGTQNVK